MDIGLLNILRIGATASWDFRFDMAQGYAMALRNAIELHIADGTKKQECFFLSLKGTQTARGNFEDRLYVGDVRYVENHLRWNDEELADDDQIVNVIVIEGPVTRDGGACSYGTKDFRNQILYANSIPQVVGHIFVCNTPGGESACRNDYDEMFADCRANNKKTVQYVDGMCGSSGVNLGCRCDRVIVRNPKDDYGCIGSMAAFWATPDGAVDHNGTRYVEVVGDKSPNKNDWYREAAQGDYEKLKAMVNRDTEEFQQTVRENRPNVKEEHLTGTVFEAQEVLGSLVDEIGDFNRAIECVLQLADGSLASVRDAEVIMPEDKPKEQSEGEEPEDKTQEGQQPLDKLLSKMEDIKFFLPTGRKVDGKAEYVMIDPKDLSTPKNNTDMTEEEKKAAEVAEQPAATQEETPATQQPAEEAQAPSDSPEGGEQGTEAPAVNEESPAQEEAPATEEAPAQEETPATEKPAEEPAGEAADTEAPADELAQVKETLHTAEAMIADRDKEIASLKETLATLKGIADERDAAVKERNDISASLEKAGQDYAEQGKALSEAEVKIAEHVATIETLKKQVADLKAEVKELAGKPAPMTNADSGIPADNGTGAAPETEGAIGSAIREDMTLEEKREAIRKQDAALKARREKSMMK